MDSSCFRTRTMAGALLPFVVLALLSGTHARAQVPPSTANHLNLRPIIGILTQPIHPAIAGLGNSYIVSSYVKYLEAQGARVVPLHFNSSQQELVRVLHSLNGVLFAGGVASLDLDSAFMQSARTIYNTVFELNQRGVYYPLWGTCLGFEMLMALGAEAEEPEQWLGWFDAENISMPLNFTEKAQESRLFGALPARILDVFASRAVTMNSHHRGVTPDVFRSAAKLVSQYHVLSTNMDRKGVEFVSTVEHVSLPIWGTQWHPEKPGFEWDGRAQTDHSPESILANHQMARVFVNHARQNHNSFDSFAEEELRLISRHAAVYTYDLYSAFQQCFVF